MTLNSKKKKFQMPHTYALIALFILLAYVMTFIIPSGEYSRVENPQTGAMMVDPDSFQYVDKDYLGIFDLVLAIPKGMENAAYVIFFIFLIVGSFQIVFATGAIEAGIGKMAKAMRGKEILCIPIFMIIFGIGGATFGMAQETIVFIPIGIMLARSLGYDAMVGFAMVSIGAQVGFHSGWMNPFTVGVAQGVAELPLFSGILLRLLFWVVYLTATSWYIIRYARKVKADKSLSVVRELELADKDEVMDLDNLPDFTKKQGLILCIIAGTLVFMVVGIFLWDWYITEMGAIFVAMGIIIGIVDRMGANKICEQFIDGAQSVVFGSLLVGIAQAIVVIFQEGQIIDTIVYGLSNVVMLLPDSIAVLGMFIVQMIINFFINSGSGQAVVTMPVLIPMADIIGITRQTAITAFQFGDGMSNAIFPTSPVLMAVLSVAKIRYDKYLKWILPLFGIWCAIAVVFLLICNAISYGPF